jgi:pilus assembly protein Flp/PilA
MKLLGLRKTRWGIAMTEYLIILGIVAIAAIAIIGVFGKQIKQAFNSSTAAMAGVS